MKPYQIYEKLQLEIEAAKSIPPCQTTDPEIWFGYNEEKSAYYKTAKKFCSMCPVQTACAEYALVAGEPEGVWGGLTPNERKKMRAAKDRLYEKRMRGPAKR